MASALPDDETHEGDTEKLRRAFRPKALTRVLTNDIMVRCYLVTSIPANRPTAGVE